MKLLMRLSGWLWRSHEKNAVKGGPQALCGGQAHSKVSYHDAVAANFRTDCQMTQGFQGHIPHAVDESVSRGTVEINERSVGAGQGGNFANNAWNGFGQQQCGLGGFGQDQSSVCEIQGRLYRYIPGHFESVEDAK